MHEGAFAEDLRSVVLHCHALSEVAAWYLGVSCSDDARKRNQQDALQPERQHAAG